MQVLFEIGIEELPESEVFSIEEQLRTITRKVFENYRVNVSDLDVFVAARRIGFLAKVADYQRENVREKRGPARSIAFDEEGHPTKALEGFLRSCRVTLDDIKVRENDKGTYVYAIIKEPGKPTEEILNEVVDEVVKSLHFARPMRWGENVGPFVRPVHWIVLLANGRPMKFSAFKVVSNRASFSHRYLGIPFTVDDPSQYLDLCRRHMIVPKIADRRSKVVEQLREVEETRDVEIVKDDELIDEVVALTEYPTAFLGEFKRDFLELPEEVVKTTLKHHQRVFAVLKDGNLQNAFVAFVDGPRELSESASAGYSRVINARLDDAKFYFERDRKRKLADFVADLEGVVFQHDLGTLKDKVRRIQRLSAFILKGLGNRDPKVESLVDRAAFLSKADTATMLVYEFPELQGVVGRIYASMDGEPQEVCQALEEQYQDVPSGVVGAVVSVADKIDTIVGNFAVGNVPSGSRDPYGLKRKAISVVKILIGFEWDLPLDKLFQRALELLNMDQEETLRELDEFFRVRLEGFLQEEKGFDYDVVRASLELSNKPLRAFLSATALQEIKGSDLYDDLVVGFERVFNITKNHTETYFDSRHFVEKAEFDLFEVFLQVESAVEDFIAHLDYRGAMRKLAELRRHIDRYFDEVFVMDRDLSVRMNRLSFLKRIALLFKKVGDLNWLERSEEEQ
ncbi:MAG: glycine--tRNA ligase subunit beta [Thermotogae bacterium]|nr:glycine--tRNA ligase subunit beta [Thermotogota bacterium]